MQPVVPAFRCWFSCRNEWLFSAFAALLLLNFGSFTVSGSARAAVGRLPGQFSVTSTGAATYDIALAIPAGINGLTPQIALHYSSTAGDGPLGVGWSITGLSEISRCSKTAATNGAAQGIHFDTTDQFCLDGMPLVKEAGGSNSAAYGADGAVYRTEVDAYIRVISHGAIDGGPQYFEALQPDGRVSFYGDTTDSRFRVQVTQGTGSAYYRTRTWALNQVQDKFYNSFRYTYGAYSGGEFLVSSITWTDHCASYRCAAASATGARYQLVFTYVDRAAATTRSGYLAGSAWNQTKQLLGISVLLDDTVIASYPLTYETPTAATNRLRLSSVKWCAAGSPLDCRPATTLGWTGGAEGWNASVSATAIVDAGTARYGDFDGDGRTDMIGASGGKWRVRFGPFTSAYVVTNFQIGVWSQATPGDFNGDGRTDLLYLPSNSSTWRVLQAEGSGPTDWGFQEFDTLIPGPADTANGMSNPQILDFDGDGLPDLLYVRGGVAYERRNDGAHFSGGSSEVVTTGFEAVAAYWNTPLSDGSIGAADFNGDGRDDALVRYHLADGTDNWCPFIRAETAPVWSPSQCVLNAASVQTLDINGDGLTDILYREAGSTGQWRTRLSTGTWFGASAPVGVSAADVSAFVVVDYNGDGRDDLVRANGANSAISTSYDFVAMLSTGAGYSNSAAQERGFNLDFCPRNAAVLIAADIRGTGQSDIGCIGSAFGYDELDFLRRNGMAPADLVESITDGQGNAIAAVTYKRISDDSVYTASTTQGMPLPVPGADGDYRLRGGTSVMVASYQASDAIGGMYTTSYHYWNGYANGRGRGFLGFAQVSADDGRAGAPTAVTQYRLDFPLSGRLRSKTICPDQTSCATDGTTRRLSTVNATWQVGITHRNSAYDPEYHQVAPAGRTTTEYKPGDGTSAMRVSVQSITSWNWSLGAPLAQTAQINGVGSTQWTTTQAFVYGDDGLAGNGNWCLGQPTRVDETRGVTGAPSETRTQWTTYYANCTPQTRKIGVSGDAYSRLLSTMSYDTFGNLADLRERSDAAPAGSIDPVSGNYLMEHHTTFEYAADASGAGAGYHLTTVNKVSAEATTDSCGGTIPAVTVPTRYTWNFAVGKPASETSPGGQVTQWTYDAFGRKLAENQVTLGSSTSFDYLACGSCFTAHGTYRVHVTTTGGQVSDLFFDSLDRQVGTSTVLIDGRESRQAVQYNALGQASSRNVPYINGAQSPFSVTYQYDDIGRLIQSNGPVDQSTPTGAITTYAYNGLDLTVTDAENRQRVLKYNADGTLAQVTERNPAALDSVTDYGYTPFGLLARITDPGNLNGTRAETTFLYNGRGFMTSRTDLDRGQTQFDYDAFGNLEMEARANGTRTITSYDALGRRSIRVDKTAAGAVEQDTRWQYQTSGPGLGQLQEEWSVDFFRRQYLYNSRGLVQRRTVATRIGSATYGFITEFSYDAYGRLATVGYPVAGTAGRSEFTYSYANGYPKAVCQSSAGACLHAIYTVDTAGQSASDALGRVTSAWFGAPGAGPVETYSYDPANLQLTQIATTDPSAPGSYLQYLGFAWDKTGNLKGRTTASGPALTGLISESLGYDALNRLASVTRTAGGQDTVTMQLSYEPNGNIRTKMGTGNEVGTYSYGTGAGGASGGGPHAVVGIAG
ncbi:MAG: VCBS repeat-containing protein, partial [Gammaproteobacteria bacterium]|nr:VCBS repeat-containing protein [Gammaproteobacteria bacterium]